MTNFKKNQRMKIKLKKMTLLFGLLAMCYFSIAQEQFLTDKEGVRFSGFFSLEGEVSEIGGNLAVGGGANVALIFNRSLYVGLYGSGVVFDFPDLDFNVHIEEFEELDSLNNFDVKALAHGGIMLGGVFQPHKLLHTGASVKLGYGDLAMYNYDNDLVSNDFTFVITPQVEAEINVARWFKVKLAGGYRFATDLRTDKFYDKNFINSPTGNISLIFGWFGEKKLFEKKEKPLKKPWPNDGDNMQISL